MVLAAGVNFKASH